MKQDFVKKIMGMITVMIISAAVFTGCGRSRGTGAENTSTDTQAQEATGMEEGKDAGSAENTGSSTEDAPGASELIVRFGDQGEAFTMHLESNETAAAIARYVGTSDWRLPIYEYDDDMDYDVLQYYDIPSRYEIPSNSEMVTEAKAGDVFYSDPNRIVLFYHDTEVSEAYTKIGAFDPTDEFVAAVKENPTLEGWGNKIILLSQP